MFLTTGMTTVKVDHDPSKTEYLVRSTAPFLTSTAQSETFEERQGGRHRSIPYQPPGNGCSGEVLRERE